MDVELVVTGEAASEVSFTGELTLTGAAASDVPFILSDDDVPLLVAGRLFDGEANLEKSMGLFVPDVFCPLPLLPGTAQRRAATLLPTACAR